MIVNVAVDAHGGQVETRTTAAGEPLLVIQTALAADELTPLATSSVLTGRCRTIELRRRGYNSSSPARRPGSVAGDAADCLAVLRTLDGVPAHVVGVSYSAAVALELAASAPQAVATLTLMEPPPLVGVPDEGFLEANRHLVHLARQSGVTAALDEFSAALGTQPWSEERQQLDPTEVAAIERDAVTFFEQDLPALLGWRFEAIRASTITAPVLYIGGAQSHPWFIEVARVARGLFPGGEHHLITGAGHSVASTHTTEVAELVADFIARHPFTRGATS
ncbi:alpha/beta fold hydrolase [Propionibacteriaceae bacterium G1746]|uniref:alpha/beta fold hydrolase n=1 Tax=Aestuariimicrobium sp. G57 TaxID=3418485 RepID=UPI003C1BF854